MHALPAPSPDGAAHSARVSAYVREEIRRAGGWIPFARYMELVLHAPGLGYYAAGSIKFGAEGDFITAPEMTSLFGRSLARCCAEVLAALGGPADLLELGAGSGKLARDLLMELDRLGMLPARYLILEPSAELAERQRRLLATLPPALAARVSWLDHLPEDFTGIALGNEVLDALPVHLLLRRGDDFLERGVVVTPNGFGWEDRPCRDGDLIARAAALVLPEGYLMEIHRAAARLVHTLAQRLRRGLLLFLDYGFGRAEYYHPQRAAGTLMGHYRHHAHADPFLWPGLSDITAHVDFTAIAEAGAAAGLELAGYTTQAAFLLECGITDLLAQVPVTDTLRYAPEAQAVGRLLSPAEMGELFKVIALGRALERPVPGFTLRDARHRL